MQLFNRLPGSVRSPSGLEWVLWRKLPLILLVGTLIPLLVLGVAYLMHDNADPAQASHMQLFGYVVIGVLVFHWTAVITLGIGCALVMVMKGPAYVADGMNVAHRDLPNAQATEPVDESELPPPAAPDAAPRKPLSGN